MKIFCTCSRNLSHELEHGCTLLNAATWFSCSLKIYFNEFFTYIEREFERKQFFPFQLGINFSRWWLVTLGVEISWFKWRVRKKCVLITIYDLNVEWDVKLVCCLNLSLAMWYEVITCWPVDLCWLDSKMSYWGISFNSLNRSWVWGLSLMSSSVGVFLLDFLDWVFIFLKKNYNDFY